MWAVLNRTPFAADRNWTRDKDGAHRWIVALRATFTFSPDGRLTLAEEQVPPFLAPEYFGEPGRSSLRHDSDLLAPKPTTDVLVIGSAHAPGGRAAATVAVGLRLGPLQKQLLVHGDRFYTKGDGRLMTTPPARFVTRPIRYELAFGGTDLSDPEPRNHRIDERNPIGRGFAVSRARLDDQPAHVVEYPDGHAMSMGPAGFGPIDAAWLPRRRLAGTYDEAWQRTRRPLLPDDYDPAYALSSPVDQRTAGPLTGGERLELVNLTPNGRVVIEIPRVTLAFTTAFGSQRRPQPSHLTSLIVEPDEARLSVVWQSTLRVPAPEADYLDETEITMQGQVS